MSQDSALTSGVTPGLTHLDEQGQARMVNVGGKTVTARVAIAVSPLTPTAS
ncbi:MAG: hypothetical protein FD177_2207 [Desulfovibrionaceae bacterium]|nr:MAG: hypothetical protein FD177_2207 [Desulfovibrionaceae bacterium]